MTYSSIQTTGLLPPLRPQELGGALPPPAAPAPAAAMDLWALPTAALVDVALRLPGPSLAALGRASRAGRRLLREPACRAQLQLHQAHAAAHAALRAVPQGLGPAAVVARRAAEIEAHIAALACCLGPDPAPQQGLGGLLAWLEGAAAADVPAPQRALARQRLRAHQTPSAPSAPDWLGWPACRSALRLVWRACEGGVDPAGPTATERLRGNLRHGLLGVLGEADAAHWCGPTVRLLLLHVVAGQGALGVPGLTVRPSPDSFVAAIFHERQRDEQRAGAPWGPEALGAWKRLKYQRADAMFAGDSFAHHRVQMMLRECTFGVD